MSVVKEGYLIKQSLYLKKGRKRWIVLNYGYMDCYKDNALLDATEIFDLSKFNDVKMSNKKGQFELVSNDNEIDARHNNRIFIASSTAEMNDWISKIKQCMIKKAKNKRKSHHKSTPTPTPTIQPPNVPPTQATESAFAELSDWYSSELHNLRSKHEKEQNEQLIYIKDIESKLEKMKNEQKYEEIEGKVDEVQCGLLIFQKQDITNTQLMQIQNHFESKLDSAPKILLCNQYKCNTFGTVCINITTNDKSMIDAKFEEMKLHILSGRNLIIPLLTSADIAKYGKDKVYERNQQTIYHKVGISKYSFSILEYIQSKIDELAKFAASVQIVDCYNYCNVNYKQIAKVLDNPVKSAQKVKIIWQWKNEKDEWISYDSKTCQKVEALPIDGMYECATNSFIAKISKRKALHVNISTDTKRDVRRIKKNKSARIYSNSTIEQTVSKSINHHRAIKAKKVVQDTRYKTQNMSQHTESEYVINWQWKNDQNRWIVFDKEMCSKLEALPNRESYEYTEDGIMYKVTKETRNFGVQINLETFQKRHIRQTRRLKVDRMKEMKYLL